MKKSKWTTTKLIATGALTVLRFFTNLITFTAMLLLTGTAFGGIALIFISPLFAALVPLVINQFGATTLYSVLLFILYIPTPGIWPKIFSLFVMPLNGFIIDLVWLKFKKNEKRFSFIAGFVNNFIITAQTYLLFFTLGTFFTDNIPNWVITPFGFLILTIGFSIIGGFSGLLGHILYNKIKHTTIIKRIQK